MKKTLLVTTILSAFLLSGCGELTDNSGTSESLDASVSMIEEDSFTKEALQVTPLEGAQAPQYDAANKTYSFEVGADDLSYELKGAFEGSFVINNTEDLEQHGSVAFILNGVNLTNMAEGGQVFAYGSKKSHLTLKANDNTINKVAADDIAINSSNNLELCGNGSLTVSSKSNHAAKADDIRIYDKLSLMVNGAGKDGLHGDHFVTDNAKDGGEKVNFSGTIAIKNVTKQAFDFSDDSSWDGSITIGSGTSITIDGCENVFKTDMNLVIDGSVSGVHINKEPIAKDKNYSGTLNAVISGYVSFNGNTLAKGSYTY